MTTLQAKATRDQCAAIRKEAWEKYELMDHCLDEGDWMIAFGYMTEGDNLMALAARLEERQAKAKLEYDQRPDVMWDRDFAKRTERDHAITERERLNRAAGLS